MKTKKIMALLMASAMVMGTLTGCGGNTDTAETTQPQGESVSTAETADTAKTETTETASGEKDWFGTEDGKTITLQFWGGIQPEYGYDEIVENFNKEYADKGLQVEYNRYVNSSDGNLQLETYLMAGEDGGVDVFIGYGSKNSLATRADGGLLYDYSDYLDSIGFDIGKELGENTKAEYVFDDGAVWGLPTKFDNNAYLMVNKDMFDEAGIPLPYEGWTYAEFKDAVAKLTHGEGQDKVYGICWGFDFTKSAQLTYISSVLGANSTFADDSMKTLNWENQVYVDGFNLIKDVCDEGYAPSMEDDIADALTVQSTFLEGKCAMFGIFSQLRLAMDTETYPHDFTTALVPFPVPDESYAEFYTQDQANYSGDFICVAASTPYKEAACEFARWYIQGGMTPLIKAARYPLWLGTDMDAILDYVEQSAGDSVDIESLKHLFSTDRSSYIQKSYVNDKSGELSTILHEEWEDFMYGVTPTAEEALKKATERGNALLAE